MALWRLTEPLILASRSAARRDLLQSAGIPIEIAPADVDERAVAGSDGAALALDLAAAKALAAAAKAPGRLVLGADQTMSFGPDLIHKAATVAEAREILGFLRGNTHHLHSAAALAQDGRVLWQGADRAELVMRRFDDRFLDLYLAAAGSSVTETVGGYRLEGLGIHLFERIAGDHATILGLPLLAVLAALRQHGALEG
ncbi:Maf family protein [Blastochloris sulfoviridis]|uniref:Nucleoside triphosphate pyrophosphatase n=1 Tax=Blastochloris sulfoviridis TaxID=50712 RepID=A0A5M6HX66_9HYPH|nr:Maf family protein [Blastochloris sulfoviridis]KAA5600466.1 septum formation inhibitor Maf [Blastochloris sulfoviridis]